jgi:RNA 2',3'-cyclic 3'-phosphodiesterase
MRLFFALMPDAATRGRVMSVATQLNLTGRSRPVKAENFHITLGFVGEVSDPDLHIFRRMGGAPGLRRCAIALDVLEYWPGSRAIVLAAQRNPLDLREQTRQLRIAVAAQGQPRRVHNPWRAHVTLARKVTQAPVLTAMSPVAWVSHSFCLMSSKTGGDESVYTVVDSWPLLDKL